MNSRPLGSTIALPRRITGATLGLLLPLALFGCSDHPATSDGDCTASTHDLGNSQQTAGDCQVSHCDAANALVTTVDDSDVFVDGNPCTADVCTQGVPSNPLLGAGYSCGVDMLCSAAGVCVACLDATDCGLDDSCRSYQCIDGTCASTFEPDGTPLPTSAQESGDCLERRCHEGLPQSYPDNGDLPNDGNNCTEGLCQDGTPSSRPETAQTACGDAGLCDGYGSCVGCITAADCGADTPCRSYSCTAGTCAFVDEPDGTVLAAQNQTSGDCESVRCDGSGSSVAVADTADLPDDNNACTNDTCDGSVPNHSNKASGTPCALDSLCDDNSVCVACVAATCASLSVTCGTVSDLCGGMISCDNSMRDGQESAVDCGGEAATCSTRCGIDMDCGAHSDCESNSCDPLTSTCISCLASASSCANNSDCCSNYCYQGTGVCAESCTNDCYGPGGVSYNSDGGCDDGGPGADYALCSIGSDCDDCGPR